MESKICTTSNFEVSLLDLPDEVIQYILRLLPPYNDLNTCMLVCKRLHTNAQCVLNYTHLALSRAISDFSVEWSHKYEHSAITSRYSHSACYHDNSMYVFGGCSFSSTTFNDLWRLDLSSRKWHRLSSGGSYPSPKASASMLAYQDTLVLFGGLTQPSPFPANQTRVFNELHIYNITKNRWSSVLTPLSPPPLAFHSASLHGDVMVIFGGATVNNVGTNEVWSLHLNTLVWTKHSTSEVKPTPRYCSSQIYIDRHRLLVLGGCGGLHRVYSDVWLLDMRNPDLYVWTPVPVRNKQYAAPHIFCHPAVRVNARHVVTISQNPKHRHPVSLVKRISLNDPHVPRRRNNMIDDRDENVNGVRGELNSLRRRYPDVLIPSIENVPEPPARMMAFRPTPALRQRDRQDRRTPKSRTPPKESQMAMFVLDISQVLSASGNSHVEWLEMKQVARNSPEPTILYSLVLGRGEVIMFGGMYKDTNSLGATTSDTEMNCDTVSNLVHFITCPPVII